MQRRRDKERQRGREKVVKGTRAEEARKQRRKGKKERRHTILHLYLTMSLFKLLFIKEKKRNPSPVGKSGILFLSLSVSVRVTG